MIPLELGALKKSGFRSIGMSYARTPIYCMSDPDLLGVQGFTFFGDTALAGDCHQTPAGHRTT